MPIGDIEALYSTRRAGTNTGPFQFRQVFACRARQPRGMELVWFADLGHHRWMTSNEECVANMQARQSDLGVVRR